MSEPNISQENTNPQFQKYPEIHMMKKNSFEIFYDEEADMKEIEEDQQEFQRNFEELQGIFIDNQCFKKNSLVKLDSWYSEGGRKSNTDLSSDIDFTQICQQHGFHFCSICHQPKPQPQPISKSKILFPEKSFCRYILLYVFRTIENPLYAEIIRDICCRHQIKYDDFKDYYKQQRILIMGYQALKKELIYDKDDILIQNRKKAFKNILVWYFDKLATKHILLSKKQDFKGYLKFKNFVMSYYIHDPKNWAGNKPEWK
ncbi:unnamed protein product [Paramecium sonneborni]|uniref:Uncharacterized protein n=1 Tax=Paramecium sonneborni TaxID=65129 RepID=A0A8S1Q8H0_9CILI|nr:unnamed protein product [Paramecium sonneborni]